MEYKGQVLTLKELSSKFIGYPGLSELDVRSLTLEEMKVFSTKDVSEKTIFEIIRKCVLNYDLWPMSYYDGLFITLAVSMFTDPHQKWNWTVPCKHCKKSFEVPLTLEMISNFEDIAAPSLPIRITIAGQELEIGLYTVEDHIASMDKKYAGLNNEILTFAFQVKNMKAIDAYNLIRGLSDKIDIEVINKVESLLDHGPKALKLTHHDWVDEVDPTDETKSIKVDKCGKEAAYSQDFDATSLRPFLDVEQIVSSRIRFE